MDRAATETHVALCSDVCFSCLFLEPSPHIFQANRDIGRDFARSNRAECRPRRRNQSHVMDDNDSDSKIVPTEWSGHAQLRDVGGLLTPANVMKYFAQSPYFDRQCAHAKVMMRAGNLDPWDKANLTAYDKSIQYELMPTGHRPSSNPNETFFVIQAQYVEIFNNVPQVVPTGYFVVQGPIIIPAPDLFTVVKHRLDNSKDLVDETFSSLEGLTTYSQSEGTVWVRTQAPASDVSTGGDSGSSFSWARDLKDILL